MAAPASRLLTPARGVLAVLGSTLVAASAALAMPAEVAKLEGKSRKLPVGLTYSPTTRSINAFTVEYTCRGRRPRHDSDIYTIVGGRDGSKPLAYTRANGRIRTTLRGRITRFTEDGPRAIGRGKLALDARVHTTASKRVIRGSMRVRSRRCPSARRLRLHAIGPR